jgi:type II secretory pathway pseudopilin PulG
LLALALLLAIWGLLWFYRRWQSKRRRRHALMAESQAVAQAYRQHGDALYLARECSMLLRRAAVAHFPREDVAHLQGEDWLRFLDQALGGDDFSSGVGQCLADAAWRPQTVTDPDGLIRLTERWLLVTVGRH